MTCRIAAVIPARMASSRLPGKPLIDIHGLPMIEHVRRRAEMCSGFSGVYVATCDEPIADAVRAHGGRVIMTSPSHPAATDRVAEAAAEIDCTHVINVQGDEILVRPDDLSAMVRSIQENPDGQAWNAVARIEAVDELADRAIVKCVVSQSNRIMFAARDLANLPVTAPDFEPARKILGVLGYSRAFLTQYLALPRTPIETLLSVDQSRMLEHDIVLQGVDFLRGYPGINEMREMIAVLDIIERDPEQRALLADSLKG
jgi:3-deoxy-manno-octulosonate cytidylyltransferase (CMP-KDO synthetase)